MPENKTIVIGCMDHTLDHTFESANRVYDTEAVSPTINTCGGGLQPKIIEVCKVVGGIGEKKSNGGTQYFQQDRVYSIGDIALCLPAQLPGGSYNYLEVERMDEIKVVNNRVIKIKQATKQGFIECEIGGVCCLEYPTSTLRRARTIERGQISPTITTESVPNKIEFGNPDFYNFLYEIDGEIYLIRIRKLIPKECWRLMGFTDEDFEKAQKVNSNTQLYKESGNAIVVDCLEALMRQMNIKGVKSWNELTDSERKEHDDKKHNRLRKNDNSIV